MLCDTTRCQMRRFAWEQLCGGRTGSTIPYVRHGVFCGHPGRLATCNCFVSAESWQYVQALFALLLPNYLLAQHRECRTRPAICTITSSGDLRPQCNVAHALRMSVQTMAGDQKSIFWAPWASVQPEFCIIGTCPAAAGFTVTNLMPHVNGPLWVCL